MSNTSVSIAFDGMHISGVVAEEEADLREFLLGVPDALVALSFTDGRVVLVPPLKTVITLKETLNG